MILNLKITLIKKEIIRNRRLFIFFYPKIWQCFKYRRTIIRKGELVNGKLFKHKSAKLYNNFV